jgi:hypothetical protein
MQVLPAETKIQPVVATSAKPPCVTLKQFQLSVPEASAHPGSAQYAKLNHNQAFSLELSNKGERECDCEVHIDGVLMGTYRVGAGCTVRAERPTALAQRFTFKSEGTVRNFDQHLPLDPAQVGLVKAVFKPAMAEDNCMAPPPLLASSNGFAAYTYSNSIAMEAHPFEVKSGAASSAAQFDYVPLLECDHAGVATLFIRLIQ